MGRGSDPDEGGIGPQTQMGEGGPGKDADADARRRDQLELRIQHDLAETIEDSQSLEAGMEAVLSRMCEDAGFVLGEAWCPNPVGDGLVRVTSVEVEPASPVWHEASRQLTLARGQGLPGRAWETGEVVWAEDISKDGSLPRARPADDVGLRAGVAVPVGEADEVSAVLMFVVDEPRAEDRRFVRLFSTVARNLATWLRRLKAESDLLERTRELEAKNEELEGFAHAAAHDLQEPLRDISRYVQLLDRRLGESLDDEEREYMAFAVEGAQRLHRLLNDMLRYTEAGDHDAHGTLTDGGEALEAVLASLEGTIEATGATVTSDEMPQLPLARKEAETLFEELVSNALVHRGEASPNVHVGVRTSKGATVVTVEDDGPGIPPKYQEKVFDLFERLDREGAPGTGIGLALCRRIVERHGGQILLASTPGEGTTVAVRFERS